MKWAYYVKDKMKAVAILLLIIILILGNNISNRKTFTDLDHSIASIYKDRLMPATYIFRLTDQLYQKRLLLEAAGSGTSNTKQVQEHDQTIRTIIKTYETTYLTPTEKQQWGAFKQNLQEYNANENSLVKHDKAINSSFNKTLQCLNTLSQIQVSEGNQILASSRSTVSGTIIMSQLEIALLFILGIFALVLVSVNDNRVFKNPGNPLLN